MDVAAQMENSLTPPAQGCDSGQYKYTVIMLLLRPAPLMHKKPQRPTKVHRTRPVGLIFFELGLNGSGVALIISSQDAVFQIRDRSGVNDLTKKALPDPTDNI